MIGVHRSCAQCFASINVYTRCVGRSSLSKSNSEALTLTQLITNDESEAFSCYRRSRVWRLSDGFTTCTAISQSAGSLSLVRIQYKLGLQASEHLSSTKGL